MPEIVELTERQKMILKAVIDAHVRSGEPIGSKLVAEMLPVSLSSATIRNVMNELERLGYLEQPHTSAGRVPSGLGYRTYVNTLMTGYSLSETEKQTIDTSASTQLVGVDGLLNYLSNDRIHRTCYKTSPQACAGFKLQAFAYERLRCTYDNANVSRSCKNSIY